MPLYSSTLPRQSLTPGSKLVLLNNEAVGSGAKSISCSFGPAVGNAGDNGVTFYCSAAFTVQGAYKDVEASYVTIKDVNTTLANFYQTTLDRFPWYRIIVTGAGTVTAVAMA